MPKCEFSETQFSFCYTFEFANDYTPWSILPFFPSTYLEGQPGYGYDVRISGNLYFQYKVPYYVTVRRTDNKRQWDAHNQPFYRCKLNTDDEQHELLHDLKEPTNEVYYATPEFNSNLEISRHYLNRAIVENTMLFPIEDLPPYGSGLHSMTYTQGAGFGMMFSEPVEVKRRSANELREYITSSDRDSSLFEEAKRIQEIINRYIPIQQIDIKYPESNSELVNMTKNILLSYFGILWVPILSNEQKELSILIKGK